ncbi:MerR family transcriptional regulator [Halopseudomonas sp.]|mgnify:FL=1|uniref:MerR family transcriptional regulator n=1 Tax=Halopseudomonas sp. TaxID=2901191 RepID=UPI00300186BF|tara:strand:+ start:5308 stop:5721 length:414 start_codon:yes stop_codon:yes gene_type:complete
MRLGEVAQRTGCEIETIRFYEKESLLAAPVRSTSGYRRYQASHVEQLLFIRHCRILGMGLVQVRGLLAFRAHPTRDCGGGKELLDQQINRIQQQMATLQSLEQQLIALRRQCGDPQQADDCRILKNLGETQSCGDHE